MKKIVMTKKGSATMTLIQTDQNQYVFIVGVGDNATSAVLENAFALNQVYVSLKAKGYTIKPEKEPKKEAPKKTPKTKKPQKEYPDGFVWNREQYTRIAMENGFTFCDARGRIHVLKKYRNTIYEMMANENQING